MFSVGRSYTKKDIYDILKVPVNRQKGAWDTGYREYEGSIFIFSNIGVPGRTGHDYNNYWDGDTFHWEGKTLSNINQPLIRKMLEPDANQNIYLFTREDDKMPFVFEGSIVAESFNVASPIQISWRLIEQESIEMEILNRESKEYREGEIRKVIINKYERDPSARRACLKHYGIFCQICRFDFFKVYGEAGKNFIHVHHVVKISDREGANYLLDPIKDLIPVCPNCHSIIHRKKEMYSVEYLKNLLKRNING